MKFIQKLKNAVKVPLDFLTVFFFKMTHHKGKKSSFKTFMFVLALCYLLIQPLSIIRTALASSFVGYMLNNFTNNVMDSVIEVGT